MRRALLACFLAVAIAMPGFASAAAPERVVIRIVLKGLLNSSPEDVAHVARIERAMAERGVPVDIRIVDVSIAGYAQKLSLMLLSRDIPDLIGFQGADQRFVNQGILEDWRPWIARTKYLKAALWPHNRSRLENYPYLLNVFPARTLSPVIRQDWLAQTRLPLPQSLDQWTVFLQTVAGQHSDASRGVFAYGILAARNTDELDMIFDRAFGISTSWMRRPDGQWISSRVSAQELAKLQYYRMLVRSRLLDPEYVTTDWELKEDKFYTGRGGVAMVASGVNLDIYRAKLRQIAPGTELALLDPPGGIGKGLRAIDVSKEDRGFAMSVLSKHKAQVVALLEFMASPAGQMMDRMGFEGVHYVRRGGGFAVTPKHATWYPRFVNAHPSAWTPPTALLSPVAAATLDQGIAYFAEDNAVLFPDELLTARDATENYYRTSVYRFVSGQKPFEDWGAYVDGWYAAGGRKLTEYARSVLP